MNYTTIMNLSKTLVNVSNELKEQEIKYLTNPRCKRPSFSTAQYYLGQMATHMGLPEPTLEQTEAVIRASW